VNLLAACTPSGKLAVRAVVHDKGPGADCEGGEEIMAIDVTSPSYKPRFNVGYLAFGSLALGLLGGAFYWWVPLGMVLSLTGAVLGFVGWTYARRKGAYARLLVVGVLLSLGTLALDIVIASMNLESVVIQSLQ
jgi:hypothetical protein